MFIGAEDLNAQIRGNVPGAELLPFIEAACDAVVQACGPIEEDDITERVRTGSGVGVLRYPAQSVTSGATLLDGPAGLVEGVSGDVTYKVGYATPPGWAKTAAVIIAEHLWQTRRGAEHSVINPITRRGCTPMPVGNHLPHGETAQGGPLKRELG